MPPDSPSSIQVACPKCLTANRVPLTRLEAGPKCGKCGAPLLDEKPIALDEASFDAFVARTHMPVLIDFWAPWCAPCRAMAPAFERVAAAMRYRVRFAKINTDEAQGLGARLGIRGIPTLILFRDGQERNRVSGAMDANSLERWATQSVGTA